MNILWFNYLLNTSVWLKSAGEAKCDIVASWQQQHILTQLSQAYCKNEKGLFWANLIYLKVGHVWFIVVVLMFLFLAKRVCILLWSVYKAQASSVVDTMILHKEV